MKTTTVKIPSLWQVQVSHKYSLGTVPKLVIAASEQEARNKVLAWFEEENRREAGFYGEVRIVKCWNPKVIVEEGEQSDEQG